MNKSLLITDDLLLNFKRCRRRAFLEVYGDKSQTDPEKDFLLKLRQEHRLLQEAVITGSNYQQPNALSQDWQARANQTKLLMQLGVERIYRGLLLQPEVSGLGITCVGSPDLLIKQPGKSAFGDWFYIPLNIKLGTRPKPEYQIVAAFQAQILANIQGVLPPTVKLILRRGNTYQVNLEIWLSRMQEVLNDCIDILQQQKEPEVFISRQRCSLCHWHSHCYALAESTEHLSLIPGVTPSRYEYLQTINVDSVESLAAVSLETVGDVFGIEIATKLKLQAQSLLENRAFLRKDTRQLALPTTSIEIYFDIEAEPNRNLDYLLGVLLVNKETDTAKFYPFLAENPEAEELIWEQFLSLVSLYPDAPIFHYSEYEVDAVKRLAKVYGTPRQQIQLLLSRFVDLHEIIIETVILPVRSYSLKALAQWLGFQWRDRGVRGDQTVCWYDQWLKNGDRSLLEAILRYNEDDCRATYLLKNWLIEFFSAMQVQ
ncbi:MAG: TM0106 family RecB-like putative nuclease [Oscillatoria sp. PMC 1068.18]|nr:TM0106 family RecB-like putative nuclease [Oscillatoria sp. PMC 1076.18]MEC4988168.1 TM0106 family RecB-like putative nuclease [Oscillatoria sp. PMC 1068.18]